MMQKYTAIKQRAEKYKDMLKQVVAFRESWKKKTKEFIREEAQKIIDSTGLEAYISEQEEIKGLAALAVTLGNKKSGLYEQGEFSDRRDFFKAFGNLVFSQLFNGKIQVWMSYPYIEGLIEPKPPKLLGIYRPNELDEKIMLQTFEDFLKELIEWEDYDDDNMAGQTKNIIGFGNTFNEDEQI